MTVATDGSERTPRRLIPQTLGPLTWSAAGELILDGPTVDIVAAPAAGGDVGAIVATDSRETDPSLSPSGRWLAYASDRTGQDEIWVQGYPEGVPVRVSGACDRA